MDHALGNAAALEKTVDVSEWHINADEPIALDYNTDFKSDGQITSYYAADAYRMSDHDPVIISMQLDAPVVEEEDEADDDNGSGGSLGFLWLALLGLVAIRRKS